MVSMRQILVLVILILFGARLHGEQQSPADNDPASAAMETRAKELGLTGDIRKSIREKGSVIEFTFAEGVDMRRNSLQSGYYTKGPNGELIPAGPYKSDEEALVHETYCGASSAVVASFGGSRSRITKANSMVYTVSEFTVVQAPKSSDGISVGMEIYVVNPGGTVVDGSETIKMHAKGAVSFKTTEQYLLLLQPLKGAPSNYFTIASSQVAEVRDGKLYPANEETAQVFAWGEPLTPALKRREDLVQRVPCGK